MYRTNRFAKGGVTKGASHEKGGIKFRVKSTGQMVELEGGEGVINKAVMSSASKVRLNGEELTPCEAASKLNQMKGGGVPFDCDKFERGGIVQYYDTAVSPIYPSSVSSLADAYDDVEYLQMGGALVFAKGGIVDVVDLQSLTAGEQRKALQAMGVPPSTSNRQALAMMLNKIQAEGTDWLTQALGRDISRKSEEQQRTDDFVRDIFSDVDLTLGTGSGSGQGEGEEGEGEGQEGGGGQGGGEDGEGEDDGQEGGGGQGDGQDGEGEADGQQGGGEDGEGEDDGQEGGGGDGDGDLEDLTDDELEDLLNQAEGQAESEQEKSDDQQPDAESDAQDALDKIQQQQQSEKDAESESGEDDQSQEQEEEEPQDNGHDDTPDSQQINEEESWIKLIEQIGLGTDSVQLIEPMRHDVPFDLFETHPKIVFGAWIAGDDDLKRGFNRTLENDNSPLFPPLMVEMYLNSVGEIDLMDYMMRITKVYACSGAQTISTTFRDGVFSRDDAMHSAQLQFASKLIELVKNYSDWPDVYTTPITDLPFFASALYPYNNPKVIEFFEVMTFRELVQECMKAVYLMAGGQKKDWSYSPSYKLELKYTAKNGNEKDYEIFSAFDRQGGLKVWLNRVDGESVQEPSLLAHWENDVPTLFGRLIAPFTNAVISLWTNTFDNVANNIAKRGLNLAVEKSWLKTWAGLMANYDESRLHLTHEIDLFKQTDADGVKYEGILINPMQELVRGGAAYNSFNTVFDFGLIDGCTGAFLPFIGTRQVMVGEIGQPENYYNWHTYPAIYITNNWAKVLTSEDGVSERDKNFARLLSKATSGVLEYVTLRNSFHSGIMDARRRFWGVSSSVGQAPIKKSDIDILIAASKVIRQSKGTVDEAFTQEIERLQKQYDLQQSGGSSAQKRAKQASMPEKVEVNTLEEAVKLSVMHYYNTPALAGVQVWYRGTLNYKNNPIDVKIVISEIVNERDAGVRLIVMIPDLRLGNTSGTLTTSRSLYRFTSTNLNVDNLMDSVLTDMFNNTSDAEAYRKEVARVPSITVEHPIYTFANEKLDKVDGYKKFTPKNVGKSFNLSPTMITGVGTGYLFVGKQTVRKRATFAIGTAEMRRMGVQRFLPLMELANKFMRSTGLRITIRPRDESDLIVRDGNSEYTYDSGRYTGNFLPLNYNTKVDENKVRPMSDELDKAVKMYLKDYPEIYGLTVEFDKAEYTFLTFQTKVRGGRSYIPMKNP